jgi:ATP-binding protein involved in chromosome partitioning
MFWYSVAVGSLVSISLDEIKNKLNNFYVECIDYSLQPENISQFQSTSTLSKIVIQFSFPVVAYQEQITSAINKELSEHWPELNFQIDVCFHIKRHAVQPGLQSKLEVKNIICVAAGKGGVGKSTISTMMSLALQKLGAKVGLVDADIYGPSIPHMLGSTNLKPKIDKKKLYPIIINDIQTISMGHLVSENSAMIWRGPMATQALQQLVNDTAWEPLDYLIIDMPPGTGDIPLSLAQKIPVAGSVVVTTPQDVALLDVRRAIAMFAKLNISVLGIVENMAYFKCPHCAEKSQVFGQGGGESLSQETSKPLLGQIPLQQSLQQALDKGQAVQASFDTSISQQFMSLALNLTKQLSTKKTALQQVSLGAVVVE